MHNVVKLDGWSSPVVQSARRTTFTAAGSVLLPSEGCWDFAILKSASGTIVRRTADVTSFFSSLKR